MLRNFKQNLGYAVGIRSNWTATVVIVPVVYEQIGETKLSDQKIECLQMFLPQQNSYYLITWFSSTNR